MRLIDDVGAVLDAELEIETIGDGLDVVMHSRGGNKGAERNPAYNTALQLVLERMKRRGATLVEVVVDSHWARARYPHDDRVVQVGCPVRLSDVVDVHELRVKVTEGQRLVASSVDPSSRGGNKHKRIRLSFRLGRPAMEPQRLLEAVDGPSEVKELAVGPALGSEYYDDPIDPRLRPTGLYSRDDEQLERSLADHADLQKRLADHLRNAGIEPRKRTKGEPDYDIAWEARGRVVVGEVKSLAGGGVNRQLRVGIGQVLQYGELLRRKFGDRVDTVLIVPEDPGGVWSEVCSGAGIVLTFPPDWDGLAFEAIRPQPGTAR